MVFFLQIPLGEDKMMELKPAFSGAPKARSPRFWSLADRCIPRTRTDDDHLGIRTGSSSLDSDEAFKLPQIRIQPPTPKHARAKTPLPPEMTTTASNTFNGSHGSIGLRDQNHDVTGSTQKKQPTKASAGLERTMAASHIGDDDSGEDSANSNGHADTNGRNAPNLPRRSSIPLAPPFMVSAPGKVIVYGEHAVVHGKAALAAAISLRSYLHVQTLTKSSRTVSLFFPDIALSHTWSIDALPWSTFQHPTKKRNYYDLVTTLDHELLASLKPHIDEVSPDAPAHERKIHHYSATSFLYLFLSLGSPTRSLSCIYTLRSTIPLGAGLGSSASVSVCLASALLLQAHALSGPHPDQPAVESALQLERINRWAFVGEACIHGNPSGIDNTVSTQGKAVVFQRRDYSQPPSVLPLLRFPTLPLLLINTKQPRSTATEVAKVARVREAHPEIAQGVLEAIDRVTQSACALIRRAEEEGEEVGEDGLRHLGELMGLNHGLLVSLGVSHFKLEKLRALVEEAGVGWTKLTGAGGGGCAITLLNSQTAAAGRVDDEDGLVTENGEQEKEKEKDVSGLKRLEIDLEREGFEKFDTTLGGDGVGVLLPAVLHNESEEGEVGGEEIDQEKFLRVEGREGVEKLVGVLGPGRGIREGWRFWTV